MVKSYLACVICLTLFLGVFSGCVNTSETTTAKGQKNKGTAVEKEPNLPSVALKFLQYSPEYTEQMNAMGKEYTKQVPNVTIEFEILQADYNTVLKTRINSGQVPDVFMTGAYNDMKTYADYSADLTNEPYMKNIMPSALNGMKYRDKILGYPLWFQSYGLIYNKKLFAYAGITEIPKTTSALEDVCKKLQAKGITPFSNGYKEWWVFKHVFSSFLAAEDGEYAKISKDLGSGEKKFSDLATAMKVFDLIDLTIKYGQPKPLETDANGETAAVATDKAAMCIGQGVWAESGMLKINPNTQIGLIGVPVGEDASRTRIMADAGTSYRLNKDSKNLEEAKNWLNWLNTSDYGKKFVPEKLNATSVMEGATTPNSQLAKDTAVFLQNKETNPWIQGYWPDGYDQQLGLLFQGYVAKGKTKEQVIDELSKVWVKLEGDRR